MRLLPGRRPQPFTHRVRHVRCHRPPEPRQPCRRHLLVVPDRYGHRCGLARSYRVHRPHLERIRPAVDQLHHRRRQRRPRVEPCPAVDPILIAGDGCAAVARGGPPRQRHPLVVRRGREALRRGRRPGDRHALSPGPGRGADARRCSVALIVHRLHLEGIFGTIGQLHHRHHQVLARRGPGRGLGHRGPLRVPVLVPRDGRSAVARRRLPTQGHLPVAGSGREVLWGSRRTTGHGLAGPGHGLGEVRHLVLRFVPQPVRNRLGVSHSDRGTGGRGCVQRQRHRVAANHGRAAGRQVGRPAHREGGGRWHRATVEVLAEGDDQCGAGDPRPRIGRRHGVAAQVDGAREVGGPVRGGGPQVIVPLGQQSRVGQRIRLVADVEGELVLVRRGQVRRQAETQLIGVCSHGLPVDPVDLVGVGSHGEHASAKNNAVPVWRRLVMVDIPDGERFGPDPGRAARVGRRRAGRRREDRPAGGEERSDELLRVVAVVPVAHPGLDLRSHVGGGQDVLGRLLAPVCRARDDRLAPGRHPDPLPLVGEAVVAIVGDVGAVGVGDRAQQADGLVRRHAGGRRERTALDDALLRPDRVRGGDVGLRGGLLRAGHSRAHAVHGPHLEGVFGAVGEDGAVRQLFHDGEQVDARGDVPGVVRHPGPGRRIGARRDLGLVLVADDGRAAVIRLLDVQRDLPVARFRGH